MILSNNTLYLGDGENYASTTNVDPTAATIISIVFLLFLVYIIFRVRKSLKEDAKHTIVRWWKNKDSEKSKR